MTKQLSREELTELVDNVLHPKERGFSSEALNQQLLDFCINCPDPVAAMGLVIETQESLTASETVDRAFACPVRDVASVPYSELPHSHPLRRMEVDKHKLDLLPKQEDEKG